MRQKLPLLIYGAGGSGRETAWLAECCRDGGGSYAPVAYIDDEMGKSGVELHGMPILSLEEACSRFPHAGFAAAVGNSESRANLTAKARQSGLYEVTLIHPDVVISRYVCLGRGVVVCAGSTLTTDITVGDGVQININCTVSHDCVLEDFVTLAPGAHICGNVHLKRGCYIGAGAVVKNGTVAEPLTIGAGTIVGAGACVTRSFGAGMTVVGVPAAPLRKKVADAA
jgi:sugar O-acyltransferase (sialic acid O-acetyltransferase NeuD family)